MNVAILKSFEKDIDNLTDKKIAIQLSQLIEKLENCKSLSEIQHLKKMTTKGSYYRIRVGNYRIGIKYENNTILLLRFMHRKEIYSYFP